ncbi:3-keto-steroid reductase [Parahypoxylon ruwenzoriense]
MASPPWAGAANHEQYYVLLTGANSGVGLGIGQRIIDQFLISRSLSSHLILIPTTRSVNKSRDTITSLRSHVAKTANISEQLRARAGPDYDPQTAISRVHVLGIQLDLCNLHSIYSAAKQIVHGKISDPTGLIDDVRIPRIDAALFNAGVGGWSGLDWLEFARQFFQVGLVQCTTFPSFKKALPAAVLDQRKLLGDADAGDLETAPPELAEVFCANVFGHYILAHELLPLLSRSHPDEPRGRVVWTSSIDAGHEHLDFDDFQARRCKPPYESSKRITDLICLTAELPSVQKMSASYFASSSFTTGNGDKPIKPRFYLSHPGVVCTPLFPLNWFLFFAYWCAMYLSRWCGSAWHPVEPYLGACATTWLALADQETLDFLGAHRVKWGTSATCLGHVAPKKTEVEGWGWEGKIEDREALKQDPEAGIMRKLKGRKWDAVELTEEQRDEFEDDGRKCWAELEKLRIAWELALGKRDTLFSNGNSV